ncbi:CHAT domain-containing protein [Irpex lacteus]|nr:CHAT domain-containing protein [Irpex lacteus]
MQDSANTADLYPGENHPSAVERPARSVEASSLSLRARLAIAGEAAYGRYVAQGNLHDLQTSVAAFRAAAASEPGEVSETIGILNNLAIVLETRFEHLNHLPDLEESIASLSRAITLSADSNPMKPACLNSLGGSLISRFRRLGHPTDLDEAITHFTTALTLTPDVHPVRPALYSGMGYALELRSECSGSLADLEEATVLHTRAVELTPDGHSNKPACLTSLGRCLRLQFDRGGDLTLLEKAIAHQTVAVKLTPQGHSSRPLRLNSLGVSLDTQFGRLGVLADLEAAIAAFTELIDSAQDNDQRRVDWLANLGSCFESRFRRLGSLADLEQSVLLKTRAINLAPEGHSQKPSLLSNLGNTLQLRFEQTGNLDDLQNAISYKSRSVALTPDNHSQLPQRLINLGNALRVRFERLGDLSDLQESTACKARAVDLASDSHPSMPEWLDSLANSLRSRFEYLRNNADLGEAIACYVRAVELSPDGHPSKARLLSHLGASLVAQFRLLGDLNDLENAVSFQTQAVELTEDGDLRKPSWLSNLGCTLDIRFQRTRHRDDIEKAIAALSRAVELSGDRDPGQGTQMWLHNLGHLFWTRFYYITKTAADLNEAITHMKRSRELLVLGHPHRTTTLIVLARLLSNRFNSSCAQADDLENALYSLSDALLEKSALPWARLQAGLEYVNLEPRLSRTICPKVPLLEIYDEILNLAPRVAWLGHNISKRYEEIIKLGTVANRAAAAAIAAGQYTRAVEWLENGRSIVWSQVLQIRPPLDELRRRDRQLASDLDRISRALQHALQIDDTHLTGLSSDSSASESLEARTRTSYSLALEFEKVIEKIRNLDGFEDFLRPKRFAQLVKACATGPVVLVNVHESRCDALMLYHPGEVAHVPLNDFSEDIAKKLQTRLWSALKARRLLSRFRDEYKDDELDRGGYTVGRTPNEMHPLHGILSDLWTLVVKPIIDVSRELVRFLNIDLLAAAHHVSDDLSSQLPATNLESSAARIPHITWCLTGPLVFLPLHAAGIYPKTNDGTRSPTVMDYAVSSYTPTLESLLKPRIRARDNGQTPRVLLVSQPDTPGYGKIYGTETEVATIRNILSSSKTLSRSQGTITAVLEDMKTHEWVHLACHGIQSSDGDATNSAFVLFDGKLKLSKLMSTALPNAELAVLSACQTATGDKKLSEEAVHLAAGMLTVGYKSVIGTMWSISDECAPIVAQKFYEVMSQQVVSGKGLEPAYALHEAILFLRQNLKTDEKKLLRWVPFVHFGV